MADSACKKSQIVAGAVSSRVVSLSPAMANSAWDSSAHGLADAQAATVLHEDGRSGGCRWSCDTHIQAAAQRDRFLALGLPASVQLLAVQQQQQQQQQVASWKLQPTALLEMQAQVSAVALSEAAGLQVREWTLLLLPYGALCPEIAVG